MDVPKSLYNPHVLSSSEIALIVNSLPTHNANSLCYYHPLALQLPVPVLLQGSTTARSLGTAANLKQRGSSFIFPAMTSTLSLVECIFGEIQRLHPPPADRDWYVPW